MKDKMLSLYVKFQNAMKRNDGQGMVEYALIIALIGIVLVGALGVMKGGLSNVFNKIGTDLKEIAPD